MRNSEAPRCTEDICMSGKWIRIRRTDDPLFIPNKRFAMISIDIFGCQPLPCYEGYLAILTIVERITSFVLFIPVKTKSGSTIWNVLSQGWFSIFGKPKQDGQNGQAERLNRYLKELSEVLFRETQAKNWQSWAPWLPYNANMVRGLNEEPYSFWCLDKFFSKWF